MSRRRQTRQGRPPLPPWRKRDRRLDLAFSPRELTILNHRAAAAELPPFEFVRALALYGRVNFPPIPRVHYAVVGQLARLGNLLNQSLRAIHQGRLAPDLRALLTTTQSSLAEIRHHLVTSPRVLPPELQVDLEKAQIALTRLGDVVPSFLLAQHHQLGAAKLAISRLIGSGCVEP